MTRPDGEPAALGHYYDPRPAQQVPGRKYAIRLVEREGPELDVDPMVDYIEGAEWWLARSENSTKQLRKMFDRQEVAIILYEVIGATIEVAQQNGLYIIQIQVMRDGRNDWMAEVALEDIGVYLDELLPTKEKA